ncbi:MAG TPA: MFS transporter [Clostridiaceae bacterium]
MIDKKLSNKNFIHMTMEGSLFFLGLAFIGESTVLPIFVDAYTGSMQLLGLFITLLAVSKLLPRLLFGPFVSKTKDMARFLHITLLISRPLPLLMIPVLLFSKNPLFIFSSFLILYCAFWSINGISSVAWSDIFGRTISGNRRGQLHGLQQFIGGITSFFCSYIIKLILDNNHINNNLRYTLIFAMGGIILLCSALTIVPVRDVPRKISEAKVSVVNYFVILPSFLNKNSNYKYMNFIQAISKFGDLLLPFIIVLTKNILGFNAYQVSTLIVFQVLGTAIGGILLGNISHKFGNRNVILIVEIVGLTLSSITLFCIIFKSIPLTFPLMCLVCILVGAKGCGWLGYTNYLLDVVGEQNRIEYIILNSVILCPLAIASYFAGLVIEKLGFTPLVVLAVIIGITTTILSTKLRVIKHTSRALIK